MHSMWGVRQWSLSRCLQTKHKSDSKHSERRASAGSGVCEYRLGLLRAVPAGNRVHSGLGWGWWGYAGNRVQSTWVTENIIMDRRFHVLTMLDQKNFLLIERTHVLHLHQNAVQKIVQYLLQFCFLPCPEYFLGCLQSLTCNTRLQKLRCFSILLEQYI